MTSAAALPLVLLASAAAAQNIMLITKESPSSALPECLQASYHGSYGRRHVFLPATAECTNTAFTAGAFSEGSMVSLDDDDAHYVWVGPAGVEGWEGGVDAMFAAWDRIEAASEDLLTSATGDSQEYFSNDASIAGQVDGVPKLLNVDEDGMFISVTPRTLPVLDTLLPSGLVPVGVSATPLGWGVPKHYAENLANITRHLTSNSDLHTVVGTLNATSIRKTVRYLTGEDKDSGIVSRHSFTAGARVAAAWLKREMEKTGARCDYFHYLDYFSPDVICKYEARTNSTDHVILSGHYDSRGSFGELRAPGADDDGSGSAHVLAVARAIHEHAITFEHPVTLAFFSGEEQGLFGSRYYAEHLKGLNTSILLHVQADMLAYRVEGEPMQLGLPETIELPEAGWLVGNVSNIYAPELVVGRTAACCSDHQSFLGLGYPATQVFERNGWIADPMYHNSGDVSDRDGYDFEQVKSIAKVTLATVCEVAGWKQK